jgi:hypothetical protein
MKCEWWKEETVSEVKAGARLSFRPVRTLKHRQTGKSLHDGVAVSQNNTMLVLS